MTGARIVKEFFKKFCNIDVHGNSTISVLNDIIKNNDSLGVGGGSSGVMRINVDENLKTDKTWREINEFNGIPYIITSGDIDKIIIIPTVIFSGSAESLSEELDVNFDSDFIYGIQINDNEFFYADSQDQYMIYGRSGGTPT